MSKNALQVHGIQHPAPHDSETSNALLIYALFAAPAAWALQLVVSYGLASRACYPRQAPRAALPGEWSWLGTCLVAINIAALVIAAAGIAAGLAAWRQSQGEAAGGHERVVHAGEGRTRFLAVWGIWASAWFLIQIVFATIAVFGVPACTP